jgi:hypothetical protein
VGNEVTRPQKKLKKKPKPKRQRRQSRNPSLTFDDFPFGLFSALAMSFLAAFMPGFEEHFAEATRTMRESRGRWRGVLGLTDPQVTKDQIETRYKELAKKKHPDAGGTHAEFVELVAARNAALQECGYV